MRDNIGDLKQSMKCLANSAKHALLDGCIQDAVMLSERHAKMRVDLARMEHGLFLDNLGDALQALGERRTSPTKAIVVDPTPAVVGDAFKDMVSEHENVINDKLDSAKAMLKDARASKIKDLW